MDRMVFSTNRALLSEKVACMLGWNGLLSQNTSYWQTTLSVCTSYRQAVLSSFFTTRNRPSGDTARGLPQPLHTGGLVAAPVFREIAEQAVRYLDIPPAGPETSVAELEKDPSSGGL